ncbi:MAG: flavodoxin-dependent (E)-4-hydroxy-3-methylbut-2-enyl-diphosphate synthase [Candidatus Atribacteria bacterium]|nr:flavodoxin-dependent (E)-4-hydroxy-3-methylbut-2-enyl-diphosphate synthase [Candidatus Atribacteria bacterium]
MVKDGIQRRKSITAKIGQLEIGGNHPISVQSMTNCDTKDTYRTIQQIKRLEKAGCDLVRIALPDMDSCRFIPEIKRNTRIPIMADIHFNYHIALEAMRYNIDGIRINPGNIRKEEQIFHIIEVAQKKNIMIRFGVNAGSLDSKIMEKYKEPKYEAIVEETETILTFLKKIDYHNIVLSIKSSDILDTIKANEKIAEICDYPLHIGITEAGFDQKGIIKSAIGIGIMLYKGIGDTIRVSLSGDPVKEVLVGHDILRSIGVRKKGINIIACPTCGRCKVDIHGIGRKIEKKLRNIRQPLTIAIMGCIVNGPGEAKSSDAGIAFNQEEGMLYVKGQFVGRYNTDESINKLVQAVKQMAKETDQILIS